MTHFATQRATNEQMVGLLLKSSFFLHLFADTDIWKHLPLETWMNNNIQTVPLWSLHKMLFQTMSASSSTCPIPQHFHSALLVLTSLHTTEEVCCSLGSNKVLDVKNFIWPQRAQSPPTCFQLIRFLCYSYAQSLSSQWNLKIVWIIWPPELLVGVTIRGLTLTSPACDCHSRAGRVETWGHSVCYKTTDNQNIVILQ